MTELALCANWLNAENSQTFKRLRCELAFLVPEEFSSALAEIVPAVLPEVEPLSPEFLTWLQASASKTSPDLPEVVEYPAAFREFANYVSQVR